MSSVPTQPSVAAYGLFPMATDLPQVVEALQAAGFPPTDICLVVTPEHPISDAVREVRIGSAWMPSAAGFVDTVGWLSRFGAVVIPGVGFFVGSHLFLKALVSNASTEASGNGVLAGLGLPASDIPRYEKRVLRDSFLVYVLCEDAARSSWAREILARMNAAHTRLLGEEQVFASAARAG